MAKQMYCYNCRKQTTYYLAQEAVSHNVILTVARCLSCNEPVNPHGLIDLNNEELNAQIDKLVDNNDSSETIEDNVENIVDSVTDNVDSVDNSVATVDADNGTNNDDDK